MHPHAPCYSVSFCGGLVVPSSADRAGFGAHPRRLSVAAVFPFLLFFLLDRASPRILFLPAAKALLRRLNKSARVRSRLWRRSKLRPVSRARSSIGVSGRTGPPSSPPWKNCEAARRSSCAPFAGRARSHRGGVARDEQLGLFAVPGQGDIARGRAPMLRMIEIGLVERAPLPACRSCRHSRGGICRKSRRRR